MERVFSASPHFVRYRGQAKLCTPVSLYHLNSKHVSTHYMLLLVNNNQYVLHVRCIKSNMEKLPLQFDDEFVTKQLRYCIIVFSICQ